MKKTKIDESVSEELLLEAGERQWAASLSQLKSIASIANLESYGILDLSQQNIDELVEIYTKKLGNEIMTLLETTKKLTENIGTYFSSEQRGEAQQANKEAQTNSEEVKGLLVDDPLRDTQV